MLETQISSESMSDTVCAAPDAPARLARGSGVFGPPPVVD
jgi:hypothetical protein